MSTLEHSSLGYPKSHPSITTAQKKPLTESPSGEVSLSIETVSGKLVNPTNPDANAIDVHDIAWALSRIPRFAGHSITEISYNVAQHSNYVSELIELLLCGDSRIKIDDPAVKLAIINIVGSGNIVPTLMKALLHDAHEAYTGDIPSPIKRIPELRETLKIIEMKLDHAIFSHFSLDELTDAERLLIKYCDKLAQAIEGYQFMPSRGLNWNLPTPSLMMLQQFPAPKTPVESYKAFLARYEYLAEQ